MDEYQATTYGDHIADLYDSWYAERLDPTDAVELLSELACGGRALELGIGTGRVAIPLAARGVEVVGIDASEKMVSQLRSKPEAHSIDVRIGDFSELKIEGRFSLIYVPFSTFFAIESQERQIRCLQSVASHLDDGGHFVMDAFVPDTSRFGTTDQEITVFAGGLDYALLDAMRHDPVAQVVEGHHILIKESGIRLIPLQLRYCWPAELDAMALVAQLRLVHRYGDYDGRPFDASSTRHVSIYSPSQRG